MNRTPKSCCHLSVTHHRRRTATALSGIYDRNSHERQKDRTETLEKKKKDSSQNSGHLQSLPFSYPTTPYHTAVLFSTTDPTHEPVEIKKEVNTHKHTQKNTHNARSKNAISLGNPKKMEQHRIQNQFIFRRQNPPPSLPPPSVPIPRIPTPKAVSFCQRQ